MQGQDTQESTNVVSLFARKSEDKNAAEAKPAAPASDETFENVIERNMKNNERLRKERLNANKSVLRSYRIKN